MILLCTFSQTQLYNRITILLYQYECEKIYNKIMILLHSIIFTLPPVEKKCLSVGHRGNLRIFNC